MSSVAPEMVFWKSLVQWRPLEKKSTNVVENIGINASPYCKDPHDVSRLHKESDLCKGSTDTPHAAMQQATVTVELGKAGSAKPTPTVMDEDGTG